MAELIRGRTLPISPIWLHILGHPLISMEPIDTVTHILLNKGGSIKPKIVSIHVSFNVTGNLLTQENMKGQRGKLRVLAVICHSH